MARVVGTLSLNNKLPLNVTESSADYYFLGAMGEVGDSSLALA